jgi:ABC-2 type transport system permease protein
VWVIACIATATCFAPYILEAIGNKESIAAMQETMRSPAMLAMCGIAYGDEYTFGIMYMQLMLVWAMLLVAVMNIFLVIRHTRKDEEEGRLELIGALPAGRSSNLFSTFLLVLISNIVIAIGSGTILYSFGLDGTDLAGSMLFGVSIGTAGFFFAGIAAFFAQLSSTSRGAIGYSMAVLGLAYMLRAAGDTGTEALALISPFGLPERGEIFYTNRVWPVLILFAVSAIVFLIAFRIAHRRSLGSGLLQPRNGKLPAGKLLSSDLGLNVRLLRNTVIVWTLVLLFCAAAYGSVFGDMSEFFTSSETYMKLLGIGANEADLLNPVVNMFVMILSMLSAIPVITVINRIHAEEKRGRAELIYSKSVSRGKNLLGLFVVAMVVAVMQQLAIAIGMWGAAKTSMEEPLGFGVVFGAAMNYLPALILFAGIASLLCGLLPKLSGLSWFVLVASFFMGYLGNLMNFPDWTKKVNPFTVLAKYPVEDIAVAPIVALCIASAALLAVGIVAFKKRDLITQ